MDSVWALVVKVGWFLGIVLNMRLKEHVCMVSVVKVSGLSVLNEILLTNAIKQAFLIFFQILKYLDSFRGLRSYRNEQRS
jgi:hypothetical protein